MGILGDIWEGVKDVAGEVKDFIQPVTDFIGVTNNGSFDWGGIGKVVGGAMDIGGTLLQQQTAQKQNKATEDAAKMAAQAQLAGAQAQKTELYAQAADIEESARRQQLAATLREEQIRRAGQSQAQTANAGYAASGVVSGAGSAGAATRHIVGAAEEDAYTTFLNAKDTIATLNAQAAANRRHGDVVLKAGEYAAKAGTAAAVQASSAVQNANWANTLLSLGNTATNWLKS